MYRIPHFLAVCLMCVVLLPSVLWVSGCDSEGRARARAVLGNWTEYRNHVYVLLIMRPKGVWQSSVRIADATTKIVSKKGDANGTWQLTDDQLIFTVMASDIEDVWIKNNTYFFTLKAVDERIMSLEDQTGRVAEWRKTTAKKPGEEKIDSDVVIPLHPIAVNLSRLSSGAADRFLCLSMKLVIKELMPGQTLPEFHPRAREAAILFLSSLVYTDVQDFDRVKAQRDRLVDVLNPYMDGFIEDIAIERVIVSTTFDKVEAFLIEHAVPLPVTDPASKGKG